MSTDNVVNLGTHFAIDPRARGFFTSLKSVVAVLEVLGSVIATLDKADQRFLCQILAFRLEGAPFLPATQGLCHMPLLTGMGFDQIELSADRLVQAGVIEVVDVPAAMGLPKGMGFRWPQLESVLEQGREIAAGPQMIGLDGKPLK